SRCLPSVGCAGGAACCLLLPRFATSTRENPQISGFFTVPAGTLNLRVEGSIPSRLTSICPHVVNTFRSLNTRTQMGYQTAGPGRSNCPVDQEHGDQKT